MGAEPRIGFVEDDDVIRENYTEVLESYGFRVEAFADRASAMARFEESLPDLALLDVALGAERDAGFVICRELRDLSSTLPIIFLTSHDEEVNKISGYRLGADDYLSKEASLDLVVVRIETLLRRFRSVAEDLGAGAGSRELGPLRLDRARSIVYWREKSLDLPLTHYWMVEALASAPGRALSHDELMRAANIVVEPNTVAAHIMAIRKRFKEVDPEFSCIRTEKSRGYRWIPPELG